MGAWPRRWLVGWLAPEHTPIHLFGPFGSHFGGVLAPTNQPGARIILTDTLTLTWPLQ